VRAFPVVVAVDVNATASFYEQLGSNAAKACASSCSSTSTTSTRRCPS